VKTYLSAPKLLADIERLLAANKPSFRRSPLDPIIEMLAKGRHYAWVGIYLATGDNPQIGESAAAVMTLPQSRTKILVSIKAGAREVGVIAAESQNENAFGREDRVLLENVANQLARFLTGPGKYLVRRAREAAGEPKSKSPESAPAKGTKLAAAG
jgi:putative methionine-R-sulfoxide reductase with GAF domain